jgi:stress-induced morphogen
VFDKLKAELAPTELEVQDISGGCGSMYAVSIASHRFSGLPVIRQHRLVNQALGEQIKTWHGIQLKTRVP